MILSDKHTEVWVKGGKLKMIRIRVKRLFRGET